MTTSRNEELRDNFRKEFYGNGISMHQFVVMADWWLSHLTTERTALIEEMESLKQEIIKNKQEYLDFKKVPVISTVDEYPYESGYSQAMNNVLAMIYKRLPQEPTPGAMTNSSSLSHLESGNEETK